MGRSLGVHCFVFDARSGAAAATAAVALARRPGSRIVVLDEVSSISDIKLLRQRLVGKACARLRQGCGVRCPQSELLYQRSHRGVSSVQACAKIRACAPIGCLFTPFPWSLCLKAWAGRAGSRSGCPRRRGKAVCLHNKVRCGPKPLDCEFPLPAAINRQETTMHP